VVAARLAGRHLDRRDQRPRDSAAAGVLAHDERGHPGRRRVALEHVQNLQRREAERLVVSGHEHVAVQALQAAPQFLGRRGIGELAEQRRQPREIVAGGATDVHFQSRAAGSGSGSRSAVVRSARSARLASMSGSRASAINEAMMPAVKARATMPSEATGPIL
jgi:hypothetical protein